MSKLITPTTTTTTENLGLHAYWEAVGTEALHKVLEKSGVSFAYFKMMAYYTKGCGKATFERMEAAAKEITPTILPDYDTCTRKSVREAVLAARHEERLSRKNAAKVAEQSEAAKRAEKSPAQQSA